METSAGSVPLNKESRGVARQLVMGLLVVFVVATVAVYLRVVVQGETDRRILELLGQQKVLAQQLEKFAGEAADGSWTAFGALRQVRRDYAANLDMLRHGDTGSGLPPLPAEFSAELSTMETAWQRADASIEAVLDVEGPITRMFSAVQAFNAFSASVALKTEDLVNVMMETGASPNQIYIATRQFMLLERAANNLRMAWQGGVGAATAVSRFGRDIKLMSEVFQGLLAGDERKGLEPLAEAESRALLEGIIRTVEQNQGLLQGVIANDRVFDSLEASNSVFVASDTLLEVADSLSALYREYMNERLVSPMLGNVFAALALAMLILVGFQMTRDARLAAEAARARAEEARAREEEARAREEESKETNRRNQEAILRLLGEITDLADGDLTVNATVTEDFTGAIADAINYAIEEMRGLVSNINRTSVQVASAAQHTRNTAISLSESSERQAGQITHAADAVGAMADAFEGVSELAARSQEVAEQSETLAGKGAGAVRDTISGMDSIRETIQETSKRIKRLGESSQEIGDIVGLIDDIADQTNILALNAAIQASMAGEAGRGFAVVADEVQRLAERSSHATHQLEGLVRTIQSDTRDAVISMEQSTTGVVQGAKLAEDAGDALVEIDRVSKRLAELVREIAGAAQSQTQTALAVSRDMDDIRQVTVTATEGTRDTAHSIGELAELAADLRRSVAGFKLPREEAEEGPGVTSEAAKSGTA
ncbi:MAG: methyl-accepting chemotaxis protein [Gammaproteobacteria bacterium]|nr:methyl-accepting chemotaxis protein [Gammaproteobacteria bacterium]